MRVSHYAFIDSMRHLLSEKKRAESKVKSACVSLQGYALEYSKAKHLQDRIKDDLVALERTVFDLFGEEAVVRLHTAAETEKRRLKCKACGKDTLIVTTGVCEDKGCLGAFEGETYRCQFCSKSSPVAEWRKLKDTCPQCGTDRLLSQNSP